ncbi:hypothetical protein dqs_1259 [Azoarcus olearius]|uniref:DUF4212 domain-containing protein n=1 Tax=Azoarcus sp. (strain BH72) TaxID=418699 RepID=UPI000806306A|nr:DUF4212 domain-containing protein [Azoarcus olearius]ANQ84313.1 hypothetical protein dqs_1259 [Azoarcus olearius]
MTEPVEIPLAPSRLTRRHRAYWRWTQVLTAVLLTLWFAVTFVSGFYASDLNAHTFLGFPLGFYLLAQGSLIAYVAIIGVYVLAMNWLDCHYGVGERR